MHSTETRPGTPEHLAHWHREGFERVAADTERLVALVRALSPEQLEAPVPGLDWRAVDVVAHLASVYRRYTVDRRRAADRHEVASHNAEDIASLGADARVLTDEMLEAVGHLRVALDLVDPAQEFDFHAGQPITMAGGWGNLLGELLAHGDDIARASGVPWSMEATSMEPIWRFATRVLPGWLTDEGRAASEAWSLDLGFASGPVRIRFGGGAVVVDEPDAGPPDHVVVDDPVALTLVVPYRRRTSDDPLVQLLGSRIEPL